MGQQENIDASLLSFSINVPVKHLNDVNAYIKSEHEKIEAYSGTQAIEQYGISVAGSGSWVSGSMEGSIKTYDYKAIYEVYEVPTSESTQHWFYKYKKDTSKGELKLVNKETKDIEQKYDLKFQIQGNDWGQSSVFITYQVIRLVMDGKTKDYVVTNNNSAGANNADGSSYGGGFKAE